MFQPRSAHLARLKFRNFLADNGTDVGGGDRVVVRSVSMRVKRRSLQVSGRSRRERAAALVEAAFVFPVLVTLVFGMLEFGLVFKNASTIAGATRSGVRTGSAAPRVPGYQSAIQTAVNTALTASSATPVELWIYKADSTTGLPAGGDFSSPAGCPASTCGRWTWTNGVWTLASSTMWQPTAQNACLAPASGTYPDSLGVYLKVQHNYATKLFGSTKTITDHAVMRLEPIPASAGCS